MFENKLDYEKLGLKCGLEIHQQLDADGKKLFCNCPALLRKDEPDFFVKRRLHAVAGESGEVDIAAKYQTSLGKEFVYQGYNTNCLVELDEEPPYEINEEALKIAVQIAILLKCRIFSLSQIMRKTVVDGSNTSGFQRTLLVAENGGVDTEYGRVGIATICLEEDSARIVEEKKEEIVYRVDRLGIPLIEISTFPHIKNPEQAREVALHIGDILRSCKIRRGIGTIRQDVNMSITKGKRFEIKGVQEPALITKTINFEIERQLEIINSRKKIESEVRKALPNGKTEFLRPMPGAARMYPETDLPLLRISRQFIDDAKRTLPKLSFELREELRGYNLHEELIKLVLQSGKIDEFKELNLIIKRPELIAKMLVLFPRELASKKQINFDEAEEIFHRDILAEIMTAVKNGKISESQVKLVMAKILEGEKFEEALKFEDSNLDEIEERVIKLIKEKPGLSANAYMGILMAEFRGKIDAKSLMDIIRKYLKE